MVIRKCINSSVNGILEYLYFDADKCITSLYKRIEFYERILHEYYLYIKLSTCSDGTLKYDIKNELFKTNIIEKLLNNSNACLNSLSYNMDSFNNDLIDDFNVNSFNLCFPECSFDSNLMVNL